MTRNNKLNVLFVIDHFWPHIGGGEIVFYNLAQQYDQRDDIGKVTILTLYDQDCLPNDTFGNKIEVIRVGRNVVSFMILSCIKIIQLRRSIDIIHTSTYYAAYPAWFAAKIIKKPVLITVHEIFGVMWYRFSGRIKGTLYRFAEWLIFHLSFDYYVGVSQYTVNSLRKNFSLPPKSLSVIYNGLEYNTLNVDKNKVKITRDKLLLQDKFTVVYFGRPGISKGLEYLIMAMPEIIQNIPEVSLLLIVAPFPQKRYQMMIKLIDRVNIKPYVVVQSPLPRAELFNYIKVADCVVVPSLAEGFGFSAAESCALGIPVVVSDTSSLPEVVSGKVVFVKPGDSRDIARGVKDVYSHKWKTIKRKYFYWKAVSQKYMVTYQSIMSTHER